MTDMVLVPRGALNAMLGYIEVASDAIELGHVGAKCFGDLKAAMLSAAPPASVGREEIALIILGPRNPLPETSPFSLADLRQVRWDAVSRADQSDALWAADAILAALGMPLPTPPEREG